MIEKGFENIDGMMDKVSKMLNSEGKPFSALVFSKEYKSLSIELSNDQKIAKRIEGQGSYPIVLLDQPLS